MKLRNKTRSISQLFSRCTLWAWFICVGGCSIGGN